jgi:HD-GYP domain-containing protein (c-di-GMP phosphodiesterase class II)
MASRSDQTLEFLRFVEQQPEQSLNQTMDKILLKSRLMTGAEAGSIFIVRRRGKSAWLEPHSLQNDVLGSAMPDFRVPVEDGSIAGYVAKSGKFVKIDDVYKIPKNRPYSFNPENEIGDYKTHSMLCFPLTNFQHKVIGVVQLINRKVKSKKGPVPFLNSHIDLIIPIEQTVATLIERIDMLDQIRERNVRLRQRNKELAAQRAQIVDLQNQTEEAFMISIETLARAAEIHDEDTGNHIIRVNEYSYFMAKELGQSQEFCDEIRYSAQLHDIGKMSVNTAILTKPGRLTHEEFLEMSQHPVYGYELLSVSPRLEMSADIALSHHEKWGGGGYPHRRKGEEIPLSARIVAVADVYDALRSERPYKPAFNHRKTMQILTKGDDRLDPAEHFDPQLLDLLKKRHDGMRHIYKDVYRP